MDIEKEIKSQITLKNKPMRLDNFLTNALYNKNGYYYNTKPIGKRNDFITAPEISQMFGEIIGLYLFYIWKTKIKSKINFIELGPGNGTLFKDIANTISYYPNFLDNADIYFIEINRSLKKLQKENLKKYNYLNLNWREKIDFRSSRPSIIYSNEFFDCFPVRQFILNKKWYEKYVDYNEENNKFYFKNKLVNKKLTSYLNLYSKEKILEVSFERNEYFDKICKFIKKNGGVFFTIDYGYFKTNKNFTLQAIQNHKYSNVLEDVGTKDISSLVNFKDFIKIARNHNLKIDEYCNQGDFLIKYGILEREKKLSKHNDPNKIKKDLNKLIDKNEMGKLFKFLIISNL